MTYCVFASNIALTMTLSVLLSFGVEATNAQPQSRRLDDRGQASAVIMADPSARCDPTTDYGDTVGIAVDAQGSVYVALGQAYAGSPAAGGVEIQKRSSAGVLLARWMTPGARPGAERHPVGIALDGQGALYVSDANAGHVVKLSMGGHVLAVAGRLLAI